VGSNQEPLILNGARSSALATYVLIYERDIKSSYRLPFGLGITLPLSPRHG
jgi:hypothetical protein